MDNQLERLQKAYNDIEIPEELSQASRKGIERGKLHKQQKRGTKMNGLKWTGSVAAAVIISFTVGVNTVPAFADSMNDVPVLGKLVSVLKFTDGSAGGGTIQDGVDVNFISLKHQKNSDQMILNFANSDNTQDLASSYNVKFTDNPYTMTVTVSGARNFSAVKDLETLKESKYVQDAYPLITLDDSMIRFNVTFKEPVAYEVKEYKEPAQVAITLKDKKGNVGEGISIYSLRTLSEPAGESQGMAEEMLFGLENVRVLKDQKGLFLVEAGYFNTEAEALAQLKKIQTEHEVGDLLFVEKRSSHEIPQSISQAE
ncbi:DUF4179 domain-containing protein [Paenibacillus sp. FSL K6-3166]|uniref:hypothetical protein n=1 Tax=unclassified Paenibacillus TaxID=185978 RepID=UPI000BA0539A|nr:hypothetical protein [Paenibacillus sp. VTT E-133291]OZQ98102.1 hypothetical protein CA598_02240 [Paenibacillus sp. VTT E-133291]